MAVDNALSHRPKPAARTQFAQVARREDDNIRVEGFSSGHLRPPQRIGLNIATGKLGPLAAQPIDLLGQLRHIHDQHSQCYTCPRRLPSCLLLSMLPTWAAA